MRWGHRAAGLTSVPCNLCSYCMNVRCTLNDCGLQEKGVAVVDMPNAVLHCLCFPPVKWYKVASPNIRCISTPNSPSSIPSQTQNMLTLQLACPLRLHQHSVNHTARHHPSCPPPSRRLTLLTGGLLSVVTRATCHVSFL